LPAAHELVAPAITRGDDMSCMIDSATRQPDREPTLPAARRNAQTLKLIEMVAIDLQNKGMLSCRAAITPP
jgi:hypothetical protein